MRVIEEEVSIKSKLCQEDLKKAEPVMRAAEEALNTLDKNNLTELKSFGSPAPAVVMVASAVLILFSKGKIPKDRSWKACKVKHYNDLIKKNHRINFFFIDYDGKCWKILRRFEVL